MKAINLWKRALGLVCMLSLCLTFAACSDDNDEPNKGGSGTTMEAVRTKIITQYVDAVVVPTYKSLADAAIELHQACVKLDENPTQANVEAACEAWIKARVYWERSEAFLYGAAADYNIDPHIDSWPLQKSQLDNVLTNGELIEELDADGAGAEAFATLGYGLLGFHAVEYVLFRDGGARNINDISTNELIYNKAVAEDLAVQAIRLEAAWAGLENVTAYKQGVLADFEAEPTMNYGENMIQAGESGNTIYKTRLSAMEQILQGAADISDEVGNTKIMDPVNSQNVLDVESWYSWNSIADFTDNIVSVRNAYYGTLDGSVASYSMASYIRDEVSESIDTEVRNALTNAITEVSTMPAPFRNHLSVAETKAAVDACNRLLDALDAAIEAL